MLTYEQVSTPLKKSEVLDWLLVNLQDFGFQTTGWQTGRIQKGLLDIFAELGSDLSEITATIAKAGNNETASGVSLILYSKSRFDNDIIEAVTAAGDMVLSNTGLSGHTIEVGQLVAKDRTGTKLYTNTTGGSLPAASGSTPGTLTLAWTALKKGAVGNTASGSVTTLTTPIAGVTISNPEISGTSSWQTTVGVDQELDRNLQERNRTKISTLALEWVEARYRYEALSLGARKILIDATNPRGPGSVDVYLSADTAIYGNATMAEFQEAFAARNLQTESVWPVTDDPEPSHVYCRHPSTFELDIQGVIYHESKFDAVTMQIAVEQALDDFLTLLPIGGTDLSPNGPSNVVMLSDIIEKLEKVKGVTAVTLNVPSGNITVNPHDLVVPPSDGWFGSGLDLSPVTR